MTKILAMYLPQYHEIDENNKWWGKGHTEWVSCKKAIPLFKGHNQPRIPLDKRYYDLTDENVQVWQANLAKEYGIYGFCYYHYWFNGKLLLERPAEAMLNNKKVDIPFCFSWANHTWTSSLSRRESKVLIEQTYGGEEDWHNHFEYLLPFFKDDRYIKVDGKPMFVIYDSCKLENLKDMMKYWKKKAIKNGFKGIYFVNTLKHEIDIETSNLYNFDAQFEYQPRFALGMSKKIDYAKYYNIKRFISKTYLNRLCKVRYEKVWDRVIKSTPKNGIKTFLGSYPDWDTSARWNKKGEVHLGASVEKFGKYIKTQIQRSRDMNSEFMFITAWNEWSEGAYLEPDEKNKFGYLEKIKESLGD